MKQKQDILHSLIIEVTMVLLASMIAFQVCNMLGIRMSLIPLVMVIGYVIQKLLHHLCIILAKQIKDINNITKKKNEKDTDFFSSDADSNISISAIHSS